MKKGRLGIFRIMINIAMGSRDKNDWGRSAAQALTQPCSGGALSKLMFLISDKASSSISVLKLSPEIAFSIERVSLSISRLNDWCFDILRR